MYHSSRILTPCLLLIGISFLLAHGTAYSWIYPEHRDIAIIAIEGLNAQRRATLDQLWYEARTGHEMRLCPAVVDATTGQEPNCIDFAAWPAIAGDHSCSSSDMVNTVFTSEWILKVARITAELKSDLASAKTRNDRVNALRGSDIKLQRADPEYATRAGSNNVHFLLARPEVVTDGRTYILACLHSGSELNALGAYAYYHLTALEKAARLSKETLPPEERAALALAVLADEAFALHFLEDSFAAGHVAGTWGNASQRKGTHDYYNEHGIEAVTWDNDHAILLGDAYMRPEDALRASNPVRTSLEQILDAASGVGPAASIQSMRQLSEVPDTFNVCKQLVMPVVNVDTSVVPLFAAILRSTPVPGLATGLGELPRFRAELGPFIGIAPAGRFLTVGGGFAGGQQTVGALAALEVAVRIGLGLEGVMNESGDGLVFLDFGIRQDGATTTKVTDDPALTQYGDLTSAIPARPGYMMRLRMPFWLLPGDLLIAGPILLFVSPSTLTQMAVQAGNGGVIPWQSGIATPIGRFQFVLGREIGVSFFGFTANHNPTILVPTGQEVAVVSYRSIQLDFPFLEYRPFRTFSLDQSSSLVIQLIGGLDIPSHGVVESPPGVPLPELKTVGHVGLRVAFDWRSYF